MIYVHSIKKIMINSWKFFDKQSDKVERVLK